MLKSFLVLVAAVVAISRAEIKKDEVMAQVQECIAEIQPDADEIAVMMKQEPPNSEKGKCLRRCVFEKMGFMKDGALDIDKIVEIVHDMYSDDSDKQALSKETILFCGKELEGQSLASCDLASTALTCYRNKAPSLHFA